MRKKLVVRMLCLAMAASMIGTMVPTSLYPVVAHAETAGQEASTAKAVLEDGYVMHCMTCISQQECRGHS